MVQELELRAAHTEERRLRAEREAADRRRAWEQIRDEAVAALREDRRAKELTRQADRWRQAQVLAVYLSAMEAHIATLTGEEGDAARAWLAWAQDYRSRLNPLSGTLALPAEPEVTPEALKPFMRGHSPYGPDLTYGW